MICNNCNTKLNDNDKFCYKCGNQIENIINTVESTKENTPDNITQDITEDQSKIELKKSDYKEDSYQNTEIKQGIKNNEDLKNIAEDISKNVNKFGAWIKPKTEKVIERIKNLNKKQKIIIAALIAVLVVGISYMSIPQSSNQVINKFEKAIIDNNTGKLKKLVISQDKRLSITEDNLNVIIEHYKENPSSLNSDMQYLKNISVDGYYDDYVPYTLVKKKKLFKDKYYIGLNPRYIELDSSYQNVKIDLSNGESIVQEDLKDGEIGPFIPGRYKLVVTSDSEYSEFEKSQTIDLFYADAVSYITVDIDVNQVTIDSEESEAIIYIDGKSTEKTAHELGSIPGLKNGVSIYGVLTYKGKEIKSNVATVSGSDYIYLTYDYVKPPTSEEVKEAIDNLMSDYLYYFASAVNNDDFSYIQEYLSRGSNLYNEQKANISKFAEKGISEYYIEHEIINVDYNEDTRKGTVTVREVYEISTEDDIKEKSFNNKYQFIYNENKQTYELTDLEVNE